MNDIINNVISSTWPMIIVSVVVVSTLRLTYLFKNKEHFIFYKELFYLTMIIYILALFQIVTKEDIVSWSTNNFIPFKEIFRYRIGSRLFIKNVIGNVLLFMPFGFFTGYFLKSKSLKDSLILSLITSITIEVVQMMIGRIFDVDDIILNTLGGVVGYFIYYNLSEISKKLPNFFKSEVFLDIVAIIILLGLLTLI